VLAQAVRARRIATPRASRWRFGLIGAILAPLALLMPIAALPAVVCGGVLLWRRQLARGAALIAAATVFAIGGVGLVAALEPAPGGLTDSQVLTRYFVARFAACQRAATPEYPNCAIVLNPDSQRGWVEQNGYTACRASGGSPEECVGRLP
jgi:hypothetical protein